MGVSLKTRPSPSRPAEAGACSVVPRGAADAPASVRATGQEHQGRRGCRCTARHPNPANTLFTSVCTYADRSGLEEGTLRIVRRGPGYQIRYASNHPYDPECPPYTCQDEETLTTVLHHGGLEAAAIPQACMAAQTGGAVVRMLVAPAQIQAFFRPPPSRGPAGRSSSHLLPAPLRAVLLAYACIGPYRPWLTRLP